MSDYEQYFERGAVASQLQMHRKMIDNYKEAYNRAPADYIYRLFTLGRNSDTFGEKGLATFALQRIAWKGGDRQKAAILNRSVVRMYKEKMTEQEKRKKIIGYDGEEVTVGEVMEQMSRLCQGNLDTIEHTDRMMKTSAGNMFVPLPSMHPDAGRYEGGISNIPFGEATTPELSKRVTDLVKEYTVVANNICDECTLDDSIEKVSYCGRCRRKKYHANCFKKVWKKSVDPHSEVCRKPDDIHPGDFVCLSGLKKMPRLNGQVWEVIEPASTPGRWGVKYIGGSNNNKMISIAQANLKIIVPARILKTKKNTTGSNKD
eukprot:Awhi_evm1s3007